MTEELRTYDTGTTPTTPPAKDATQLLYAALANAQGEFGPVEKNREANIRGREGRASYAYRYADLASIRAATTPALKANGLAIRTSLNDDGKACRIVCLLTHEAGGYETSSMVIQSATTFSDIKGFGALVSYLRRYMVQNMLGIAADDDADNEPPDGGDDPFDQRPSISMPTPRRDSADASSGSAAGATPCSTGEIAFVTKKLEKSGTTVAQAFTAAKLPPRDTLDNLTKDEFAAIKAVL